MDAEEYEDHRHIILSCVSDCVFYGRRRMENAVELITFEYTILLIDIHNLPWNQLHPLMWMWMWMRMRIEMGGQ